MFQGFRKCKPRLILHAGTHRTGTTTIQTVLSSNREWLKRRGLIYPDSSQYFKGARSHRGFSRAVAFGSREERSHAAKFIDDCSKRLLKGEVVLLSAEAIYGLVKDRTDPQRFEEPDYDKNRRAFLSDLSGILDKYDVSVLLCFRERGSFVESLYWRNVSVGHWGGSLQEFADFVAPWLDYDRQIKIFQDYFANVQCYSFEASVSAGLVESFFHKVGCAAPPGSDGVWKNRSLPAEIP